MNDQVKKWLRVDYNYERVFYNRGGAQVVFHLDEINQHSIQAVLSSWLEGWTGEGTITINWLDCGPFDKDNELERLLSSFDGKTYKFKNLRKVK